MNKSKNKTQKKTLTRKRARYVGKNKSDNSKVTKNKSRTLHGGRKWLPYLFKSKKNIGRISPTRDITTAQTEGFEMEECPPGDIGAGCTTLYMELINTKCVELYNVLINAIKEYDKSILNDNNLSTEPPNWLMIKKLMTIKWSSQDLWVKIKILLPLYILSFCKNITDSRSSEYDSPDNFTHVAEALNFDSLLNENSISRDLKEIIDKIKGLKNQREELEYRLGTWRVLFSDEDLFELNSIYQSLCDNIDSLNSKYLVKTKKEFNDYLEETLEILYKPTKKEILSVSHILPTAYDKSEIESILNKLNKYKQRDSPYAEKNFWNHLCIEANSIEKIMKIMKNPVKIHDEEFENIEQYEEEFEIFLLDPESSRIEKSYQEQDREEEEEEVVPPPPPS